ncbi:hypothetical protein VE04_05758 [Pseudogymnoascus sp. 24MN13]|nr:hypothetical protein VE04_05758 [Pseudogymnoascus sp. 24MN13]
MHGGQGWDHAYKKAVEFVSGLTLLEKVNITTGTGWMQDLCVGATGGIPRLGFNGFCLQDSPLGIRFSDQNSAFPAGVNAAATWSKKLFKARGEAMGEEFRDKGVDVILGPVAGPLGRSPEGGRNWEGFAPDPVLTGVAMAETIKGIQGTGVIACAKHFIGNEQEHYRQQMSSNMDDATMHEMYMWPFADAVKAGVGSVMCSYNRLNDSYACENSYLLNHLLKNELDFQGFVMADRDAQDARRRQCPCGTRHDQAREQVFAVGTYSYWGGNLTAAVLNGTVPQWRGDDLAVRIMSAYYKVGRDKSRIPINFSSWTRNTTGYFHTLGGADIGVVNQHVNVQSDHKHVIREIGARSTVLLKNTKRALPLNNPKSVAVIGEDAHLNPAGINSCDDRGCDKGTLAMGWGSGTANFPYLIAPVDALRAQTATDRTTFVNISNNYDLNAIRAAAAGKSVALVFANADSGEDYITVDKNEGDRNNLTLWQNGDAVIAAAYKHHPNITAILWAGIPGQESGNAITDVLYGEINPSAKSVFTWGKEAKDWGVNILYNDSSKVPQMTFSEGNFIDYRHFDKAGIEPSYEFGFGLSYTTFEYSAIGVRKLQDDEYKPTTGKTNAAQTFGTVDKSPSANKMPKGFKAVKAYVYPYLDKTTGNSEGGNGDAPKGSQDGSKQRKLPAGGAPGGNSGLWDEMYEVSATITNTGKLDGTEVVQLYVSVAGPDDPPVVLRGFNDLAIPPRPHQGRPVQVDEEGYQ